MSLEGISQANQGKVSSSRGSVPSDYSSTSQKFIEVLQAEFDRVLGKAEEIAPGVYTTKTDPIYAAYQNYGKQGSLP